MSFNSEQLAGKAWDILVGLAKKHSKINYGELANLLKMEHHRPIRFVLDHIQEYCLKENLPALTVLVINKDTGMPGGGFMNRNKTLEECEKSVFEEEWKENPFEYARNGDSLASLAQKLLTNSNEVLQIYQKIKSRGSKQALFRETLLILYERKCAFCGFSYPEALEGAHLRSWSICSEEDRWNASNGILLCSTHHKLFDKRILSIGEDHKIFSDENNEGRSTIDKILINDLVGKSIALPKEKEYWPNLNYLNPL